MQNFNFLKFLRSSIFVILLYSASISVNAQGDDSNPLFLYGNEGYYKHIDNKNFCINTGNEDFGYANTKPYWLCFNFGTSYIKQSYDSIMSILDNLNVIDSLWVNTFGEEHPELEELIVIIGSQYEPVALMGILAFLKTSGFEINVLSLCDFKDDINLHNRSVHIGAFVTGESKNMLVVKNQNSISKILESSSISQLIDLFYSYNENLDVSIEDLNYSNKD